MSFTDSAGASQSYDKEKYHTRLSEQIAGLLGGTKSNDTLNPVHTTTAVLKADAQENTVLKSIFEQLMNVAGRSNSIATAREDSTNPTTKTTTAALPFASGDKLVVFIRAKLTLSVETAVMADDTVLLVDSAGSTLDDSSHYTTGNGSSAASIASAFPGSGGASSVDNRYNWMGATGNTTFGDGTTDVTTEGVLDCHIMKITITI